MKRTPSERIAIALAALAALTFTSCGQSGNGSIPPAVGIAGAGAVGGCIPLPPPYSYSTPAVVGFAGTGIYFDSANIVGGTFPYPYQPQQPVGQMYVTTGVTGGPFQRTSVDGSTISLSVSSSTLYNTGTNYPYQGYPQGTYNPYAPLTGGGSTSIQGYVQISPELWNNCYNTLVQEGYIPPNSQACVSEVALNIGYNSSDVLYGGAAFLNVNNSPHGCIVNF
jgi:hypothetical protein